MTKHIKPSLTVIFSIAAALLTVIGLLSYQLDMSDNIKGQAYSQLDNAAETQKNALNTQINGQFAILESFSAVVSTYRDININQIILQMDAIVEASDFTTVAFVTPDGTAYLSTKTTIVIDDHTYFKNSLNGERAVEYIHDGLPAFNSQIVLSVPIERDGEVIGVIVGSYSQDRLRMFINMSVYDGSGYSFIISSDGTVVASSSGGHHSIEQYKNIFDFYKTANFTGDVTADDIVALILSGQNGTVEYTYNNLKRYSTYMPIGISDWYMLNVVPVDIVDKTLNSYTIGAFLLTVLVVLLAASIILVFGMEERRKNIMLAEERERLFRSDELYRSVQEMSDSLLFELKPFSHDIHVTSDYKSTLGDIVGEKSIITIEQLEARIYEDDLPVWKSMLADYENGAQNADIELRLFINQRLGDKDVGYNRRGSDYAPIWFRMRYRVLNSSDGQPYRVIGKFNNIDAVKQSMAVLTFRAERDSLTSLYNHGSFIDRVDELIAANNTASHALLLMDIDYFKRINDTYGHNAGDEALTGMASVIKKLFRNNDIIGRLGGDEISIFMRGVSEQNKIAEKAAEINRYLTSVRPYGVDDAFAISVSIGIALYPGDGGSFDKLYLNADRALYEAKRRGRKQFVFFDDVEAEENENAGDGGQI